MVFLISQVGLTQEITPSIWYSVNATSGLKLRAQPNIEAEVLIVIPHAEVVSLVDDFSVEDDIKHVKVGHFEGNWVPVSYMGMKGFVFEGLLTSLPLPSSIEESASSISQLYQAVEMWSLRLSTGIASDTIAEQNYTKVIDHLSYGIKMERKQTPMYYSLSVHFPGFDMAEVYYLLQNMISEKKERSMWVSQSLFVAGPDEKVHTIKISGKTPITIRKNGLLTTVEMMVYEGFCDLVSK